MPQAPPTRVLHLGKFFPPDAGGMEVYLADLVKAQRDMGLEVSALVHGNPLKQDPSWLWRVPVQAQLVYAPIALGYRRALRRSIAKYRPEILHLHMPNNSVFWALTMGVARDIPWVVHWHSDVVVSDQKRIVALAYKLYRPFEQAVLARARQVVVTSPPYLEASVPLMNWRSKCKVVPLGLQPPSFDQGSIDITVWGPQPLKLLSIGRLAHYKGFETLIAAAFAESSTQLLIAGDGELRSELQSQINQHQATGAPGSVRLLGQVSDDVKHALLASCNLFCLASKERTEAFGMVLLEAMAHGKPCLASKLSGSGMGWLVEQSGSGITCPPGDVQAWRNAMKWMEQHPEERAAMGLAGRQVFLQQFTISESAKALQGVYRLAQGAGRFAPSTSATLIVIPARNEAGTIGALLNELAVAGYANVLVIDDLSDDRTGDIARAAGAMVLRPTLGMGAWGGMQTGIRYALRKGFTRVVTMDADGQHEVCELQTLLQASEGVDVVIGAFPQRASRLRRIAWGWFRALTGLNVTDLTSGFRSYSEAAMRILATGEATLFEYQDIGTLLLLRKAGLRTLEVPVKMSRRVEGKSRIFNSWISVGRYMAVTTLLCLARWRVPTKMLRQP